MRLPARDDGLAAARVDGGWAVFADFVARPLRPLVRCTEEGSATCNRRPGSTLMPAGILFQRRSWSRDTPNRSAMETSVSPRRVVYINVWSEGAATGGTGTTSASIPARAWSPPSWLA